MLWFTQIEMKIRGKNGALFIIPLWSQFCMSEDRLVIDVIDNGGQWTHREWRMLRYMGVDTQILSNNTPVSELRELNGLILSGGAARVGLTGELGNCAAYLDLDIPIMGICAGHQFMAGHYGGRAAEAPSPEFGAATINLVDGGGPLFAETPDTQTVWESHNDEVVELPEGFRITASSESCEIQAMENEELNRFGLQFHPEVNDSEYGAKIFQNFVDICRRAL
jgi:GMP synthase (glutamine-hydrolysing)